ncbi:MAG: hypothetical protein ACTIJJ_06045 [Galactobacter sp.]|uniref:hypothetical protein n=1 Tax=Galactobacter sp. TaxID=2676125 RepID=UPI0025BBA039|nr:hypothetical protein [Galactobacter sp.]
MSALPLPERREYDVATQALPLVEPASPAPEPQREVRTPLSVVPSPKVKRRRLPFVLLCLVIVAAVVAAVLGMNIKAADTQYDLVRLNARTQEMHQANQATTQELDYRKAPQNLAAQAEKSGMVPAGQPGVVDLDSQKVTGKASAPEAEKAKDAEKSTDTSTTLATPMSPAELSALSAKKQAAIREQQRAAVEDKAHKDDKAAQGGKVAQGNTSGQEDTTATSAAGESKTASDTSSKTEKNSADKGKNGEVDSRGFSEQELNGGTFPAPVTR